MRHPHLPPRHPMAILTILVSLILLAGPASSQTRIHRNLTPSQGLVQSQVISLHEDQEGYLWIGTFGGLSRWDGLTFQNFSQADGMGHKEVQNIAEDSDGTLYFATKGGGVSVWKDEKFSVLDQDDGLPDNVSRAVAMMPNGDVAVGTDAGVCLIRDGQVIPPAADSGLSDILVVSLAVSREGILHVATWGDGLLKAGGEPLKVRERIPDLPQEKIRALAIGPDDQVYFVPAGAGIHTLKKGVSSPLAEDPTFGGQEFVTLFVRSDGTLMAGTQKHGLMIWDEGAIDQLDKSHGLASSTVYASTEGRDGLHFLGTWGGVSIYDQDRVVTVGTANGLAQDIVTSIDFSLRDNSLYFGFPDGGIQKFENGNLTTLPGTGEGNLHQVWTVHENQDGSLLIGSDDGVFEYDSGQLQAVDVEDGTQLRSVHAIFKVLDGGLMIMDMHGLFRLQDNILKPVFGNQESGVNKANDVLEIASDQYLLGTTNGVFSVTGKSPEVQVEPFEPLAALSEATIWDLHQLGDGRILLGTNEKGLVVYSPQPSLENPNLHYLDTTSGLSDNTVLAIAEDQDGVIYLSTNRGLNILDPQGTDWKIRHLGHQDGLGSNECVQGALAVSPAGHLWVGTIGGASRYDKSRDTSGSLSPLLKIDNFSIFDRKITRDEFFAQPVFSHRDNYLKIEFTGIHLPKPDEVYFRYRLSSVDQNWVETPRRYVQYTNLSPGKHKFEISANLPNGSSSQTQLYEFTISPPVWRTWWFILLSVLVLGGGVGLIIMFRVRQMLALERIRTRIAADLHDDIGSGLTEIAIVSTLIPRKLPDEASAKISGDVDRIGETSRRLITSMSDIVWLVNPSLDSLFDLLAKLGESSSELLSAAGVRFEDVNLVSLQKIRLPMEHRRQLLLIFKEAINNAVKYSGADHIRLEAHSRHKELNIVLTDNGSGFDPSAVVPLGGGLGLVNMQNRAENIRGKLSIESSPETGTRIIFQGPAR